MQIIKFSRIVIFFLLPLAAFSQSSYVPLGTVDYQMINRLEIKTGNMNLMYSNVKPLNRRLTTREVENIDSMVNAGDPTAASLTDIDKYNMNRFLMNNSEWSKPRDPYVSKKSVLNTFYKTKGNFYEINTPDFFLAFNPAVQYQQMFEKGNSQNLFYNSRGASIRGLISKKIGFDIYVTDNQERDPLYVQNWITEHKSVPGTRFYKKFKAPGGYDYFDNRGSISLNATKYIDLQLGYDKNFIGDGYRSLLLSDFSGNALFFKINTRIWRFNYQNLFMELIPNGGKLGGNSGGNSIISRKYFRSNYLSFNAAKWLNIGIFDAVTFGRSNHFDFQYLVPVLFLRPAESDIGSPDNAMVGLTMKANIKKTFQLYGQLMLDEFDFTQLKARSGYWANKYGYQLGVKYPDALGIKNFDVQVETNRVRPFSYSHFDSVGNYSHYNQPLAHPLGASFQEYVAIVRYQPTKKLHLQGRLINYFQGLDSAGINMGNNVVLNYETRSRNFGYNVGSGNKVTSTNINFLASYEVKDNFFIDANLQRRTYNKAIGGNTSATIFSFGFRWNMARRNFDF